MCAITFPGPMCTGSLQKLGVGRTGELKVSLYDSLISIRWCHGIVPESNGEIEKSTSTHQFLPGSHQARQMTGLQPYINPSRI